MDAIKIGMFIKQKRNEMNMSQKELASKLHVTNKTISKWETGNSLPNIDYMLPLCDVLGINLNELLEGQTAKESNESYERIIMGELKNQKRKNILYFGFSILICVMLCALEVVLYLADVDEKYATIIFIFFLALIIGFDIYYYLINKKR